MPQLRGNKINSIPKSQTPEEMVLSPDQIVQMINGDFHRACIAVGAIKYLNPMYIEPLKNLIARLETERLKIADSSVTSEPPDAIHVTFVERLTQKVHQLCNANSQEFTKWLIEDMRRRARESGFHRIKPGQGEHFRGAG